MCTAGEEYPWRVPMEPALPLVSTWFTLVPYSPAQRVILFRMMPASKAKLLNRLFNVPRNRNRLAVYVSSPRAMSIHSTQQRVEKNPEERTKQKKNRRMIRAMVRKRESHFSWCYTKRTGHCQSLSLQFVFLIVSLTSPIVLKCTKSFSIAFEYIIIRLINR